MRELQYHLVDVFTDRAFGGNPLAVFTDGQGISDELMQALTRELNLSETTFVLPPDDPANDFRVRIFTPGKELPMAGHPTIGTAFVLARERMIGRLGDKAEVSFEEGVGPIPVSLEFKDDLPTNITMTQPLPRFGEQIGDREGIAEMLSLRPEQISTDSPIEVVSCGVPFLFVPLRDLEAARGARIRREAYDKMMHGSEAEEIFLFTMEVENRGSTVHSRMFAPALGIAEDPATGGASGPLGCYLVRYGLVPIEDTVRIVSEQGIEMGRPSFIHIEIGQKGGEIGVVRVGGQCVYMGHGSMMVE